jgi:acyl-CoA synthetase (AMP-forming)/AMP-acid ligase II
MALHLPATAEPVAIDDASPVAALIYTSGTTGKPKGVMLTHRNLLFTAFTTARLRAMRDSDFAFQVVPVAHAFGLSSILISTLSAGAGIRLCRRFDPSRLADALEAEITVLQGVPALYAKLVEYLASSGRVLVAPKVRYISSGGAPLDLGWKRSVECCFGLKLNNGYGLTESASNVAATRIGIPRDDESIGIPSPGVTVRIVGNGGEDVPDGQVGEIWVSGPNIMKGYYRDEAATLAALTSDGWFRTGDLGYRAEDSHLFLVGRLKELIIRSGFNVYPVEVEAALNAHPDVVQSAVIGRKADGNEEVIGFVEIMPGSVLSVSALHAHLCERLAPYKRPQRLFIVERLPASPAGKILKAELIPLAERLMSGEGAVSNKRASGSTLP